MKTTKNVFFLTVVAIVLAITNPNKKDYTEYLAKNLGDQLCQQNESKTAELFCEGVTPVVAKPILNHYSQRNNVIFFSIYTTKVLGVQYRSLGIAGNFINL